MSVEKEFPLITFSAPLDLLARYISNRLRKVSNWEEKTLNQIRPLLRTACKQEGLGHSDPLYRAINWTYDIDQYNARPSTGQYLYRTANTEKVAKRGNPELAENWDTNIRAIGTNIDPTLTESIGYLYYYFRPLTQFLLNETEIPGISYLMIYTNDTDFFDQDHFFTHLQTAETRTNRKLREMLVGVFKLSWK